jgi:fructose-1-phosphate kinase PfkB-like protein
MNGIVLSLAWGKPLRESILFGVAAGAAAVITPGTELCQREDAERLFKNMVSNSLLRGEITFAFKDGMELHSKI